MSLWQPAHAGLLECSAKRSRVVSPGAGSGATTVRSSGGEGKC